MSRQTPSTSAPESGFSLVELLVALAIGAAVLATIVVAFGSLVTGPRSGTGEVDVTLGSTPLNDLFGLTGSTITVDQAPSYGSRILADEMRDLFWSDVRHASAVFCLGRSGRNSYHPPTIELPASMPGQSVDTPTRFLQVIAADNPTAAGAFTSYRNVSSATNGSIFILEPSPYEAGDVSSEITVRAIYEIDILRTATGTTPKGTYAVVQRIARRASDGAMDRVGFYDVFYEDPTSTYTSPGFSPLFVFFERKALRAVSGDTAADPFKMAEKIPFYMIWWPDPTSQSLDLVVTPPTSTTDPRSYYGGMGGRTSYFFVVPMIPPLL